MIKIMIANTHSKIDFTDVDKQVKKDFINMLKEKFTVRDKNLERNPMVIRGLMSADFCFYDLENSILPTGLIPHLRIYSKQNNFELEIKDFRKFPKQNEDMLSKIVNKEITMGIHTARDYQIETMESVVKYKGGIIEGGTGAGKTFIMSMICRLYETSKILVLFNRTELLFQTREKFVTEYGFSENEVGIIGGGSYDDSCRITLLTTQSYQNIFHIFPEIKVIVTDECHETGRTATAEKIIYSCQGASVKIGLSATVSVIENPYEKMKLHGNIGPIIHKIPYDKLRDMGTLATISVTMYKIGNMNSIPIIGSWNDIYETIKIKKPEDIEVYEKLDYEIVKDSGILVARKFISYGDESNLYTYNSGRNELISKLAYEKERVLILFTKLAHGRELLKLIPDGILISGDDDRYTREQAKKKIQESHKTIVIASSIFDVGVDIPAIKTLILAGSSVSNVRVMQKIGRATRKDLKTLKEDAEVVDFMQYDNPLSLKQSKKRKKIYEDLLKVPVNLV